jgi:hypothetical protein
LFADTKPGRQAFASSPGNRKYNTPEEAMAAKRAQDLSYQQKKRAKEKQARREMPGVQKSIIKYLQQHPVKDIRLLQQINLSLVEYESTQALAAEDESD